MQQKLTQKLEEQSRELAQLKKAIRQSLQGLGYGG